MLKSTSQPDISLSRGHVFVQLHPALPFQVSFFFRLNPIGGPTRNRDTQLTYHSLEAAARASKPRHTNALRLESRFWLPSMGWWTQLSSQQVSSTTHCSSCTAENKLLNPSFAIHNNVSFTVSTVNPVRHN